MCQRAARLRVGFVRAFLSVGDGSIFVASARKRECGPGSVCSVPVRISVVCIYVYFELEYKMGQPSLPLPVSTLKVFAWT